MADKKAKGLADIVGLMTNLFEIISHAHTASDLAGGLGRWFVSGRKQKEEPTGPDDRAQGVYGKGGYGDERQQWSLFLDTGGWQLDYWVELLRARYQGNTFLRRREAKAIREDLRVFLTQWDGPPADLGQTKTTVTSGPRNAQKVVEEIKKIYGKKGGSAKQFILFIAETIKKEEELALAEATREYRRLNNGRNPVVTDTDRARAREIGHQKVINIFEVTGVPHIPAHPGWIDKVEGWWDRKRDPAIPNPNMGAFNRAYATRTAQQASRGPWFVRWPRECGHWLTKISWGQLWLRIRNFRRH